MEEDDERRRRASRDAETSLGKDTETPEFPLIPLCVDFIHLFPSLCPFLPTNIDACFSVSHFPIFKRSVLPLRHSHLPNHSPQILRFSPLNVPFNIPDPFGEFGSYPGQRNIELVG